MNGQWTTHETSTSNILPRQPQNIISFTNNGLSSDRSEVSTLATALMSRSIDAEEESTENRRQEAILKFGKSLSELAQNLPTPCGSCKFVCTWPEVLGCRLLQLLYRILICFKTSFSKSTWSITFENILRQPYKPLRIVTNYSPGKIDNFQLKRSHRISRQHWKTYEFLFANLKCMRNVWRILKQSSACVGVKVHSRSSM